MKTDGASCCLLPFARIAAATCFSFALIAGAQIPATKAKGYWQPLKNQPPITDILFNYQGYPYDSPPGAAVPLLMTDGSVMIQNNGYFAIDGRVFKLTPDINGSYVNGTWSELATKPYANAGASQAVLADGRVLIEGGEYSGKATGDFYWFLLTDQGAIYDPVADKWTSVSPPSFFVDLYPPRATFAPNPIGDAPNVVLDDGTFMLEDKMSRQAALLDLKTMTWTEAGTSTKSDMNDEEGLTLLPNGEVLTVDCYTDYAFLLPGYPSNPTHSEIYDPRDRGWSSAGSTIHTLTDPVLFETGPAILRPDGTVFAVGSSGDSSIYDTRTRQWSLGPTLPISPEGYQYTVQDGPAVLLPNGHVFFAASGGQATAANSYYSNPPVAFFEFDGKNLIPEPTIPNAANDLSGSINLLPLPNGQVLSVDSTLDVEIYTPADTSHNPLWQPIVASVPFLLKPGGSYKLDGFLLNGMSQACAFGDEEQCATNYPLVRITDVATGHVFYSRTHDHSSMAVADYHLSSTHFDVPGGQERGLSRLEVVANGIASFPVLVWVQ
ncbi:MAG: hypothetical protein ABSF23_00110 [Terracidiphilus sp.]|jgi:hypothetical protein